MRYLIGLPVCLFLVSGAIWGLSQRSASTPSPSPLGLTEDGKVSPATQSAAKTRPDDVAVLLDPIAITGCTLVPIQEHNVASPIDGVITDLHVSLGTMVEKGHCLTQLDDQKLRLQVELLQIKASSINNEKIAQAMFDEADAKVKYAQKANESGLTSVPELELKTYLAQRDRFAYEIKKAVEEREEARKELEKAKAHLELHKIRSALQGEVIKVFKKPGETVKQGESVFGVARMNRLRVEGFCKAQTVRLLRVGMPILVEPELQGPQLGQLIGHTAPVNQLASAADGKLLASASDDGTVALWSWPAGVRVASLPHPGPVYAVDLFAGTQGYVVVTGGEDRVVRFWTCSASGAVEGPIQLSGHDGSIRSVALSPDGGFCASGGDDRKIALWNLATGKMVNWIHAPGGFKQAAHQGSITSLQFSGASTLVSAATDNLLKVWDVAPASTEKQSQLRIAHRGRTGDVGRLGLSADGRRLLFDHGDEIRILDPDRGSVQGVLHHGKHVRFESFACFSPSSQLILTAAGDGRLQLWKAPASPADRAALAKGLHTDPNKLPQLGGFEVCQYSLPKAAQARCGVFAPDESVFFTAGTNRSIQAWGIPAKSEWQAREARLTYVGSAVEPGTDLVRIQAEIDNPTERSRWWLPGTFVNLKVFP